MQRLLLVLLVLVGVCLVSGTAAAEIFKYVDADGKVYFTDSPPAGADAKPIDIQPNVYEGGAKTTPPKEGVLPAAEIRKKSLLETKKQPKVELFVTSWCGYCKKAEAYLRKKGIQFTTYDIEKDLRAARRKDSLTSRKGVPFALIGDQKLTGFSEMAYERALQKTR